MGLLGMSQIIAVTPKQTFIQKNKNMKHTLLICIIFILCINMLSEAQNTISIIPQPNVVEAKRGSFQLNAETQIFSLNTESAFPEQAFLSEYLANLAQIKIRSKLLSDNEVPANSIVFSIDKGIPHSEGYTIDIGTDRIDIKASERAGLFYAVQTIQQLLPATFEKEASIPCVYIEDYPRFKWRGMLFDCCRHFMDKEFVMRYIDLLAFHKMNTLHWHLTEDQGWRIEIKKYPKLTEIGAWRKGEDGEPYGGFYTQEEIKEVVAYAAKRHINVVPEIELPGHSQAALAAYPQFACTDGPFEVETEWGVFREIYCAGNDSTFQFLEDVLLEVMDLFPSEYIHIGGDEAPKYRWERCDQCQVRIKVEGLHDAHELQSYFIKRIANFLDQHNKKLIGWDEIREGGLAPNAIVQSWRGMEGAIEAVQAGQYAIVSPTSHCYFDYSIQTTDMEKVYSFNPIPDTLTQAQSRLILGGECNMWTERAPQETVDSKMFPRMLAMSEVLWTDQVEKDYSEFYERVQKHYAYLDQKGVDYGYETDPVKLNNSVEEDGSLSIELEAGHRDAIIYYSIDGESIPELDAAGNAVGTEYTDPIKSKGPIQLKAQAYLKGEKFGELIEKEFVYDLAIGKIPTYKNEYSPNYKGNNGRVSLTDGYRGGTDYKDGWQGFQKNNLEIILDLGELTTISSINSSYLQYNNSWIFLPTEVSYALSKDGKEFEDAIVLKNETDPRKRGKFIQDFQLDLKEKQSVRYIKVIARNIEECPDWHEASGSEAWLFVDEVMVN